jgi:hypothetical protein
MTSSVFADAEADRDVRERKEWVMNGWLRLWLVATVLWALFAWVVAINAYGPKTFFFYVAVVPPSFALALGYAIAWIRDGFRKEAER